MLLRLGLRACSRACTLDELSGGAAALRALLDAPPGDAGRPARREGRLDHSLLAALLVAGDGELPAALAQRIIDVECDKSPAPP